MSTPGVATSSISPMCPKCGIINKSGKLSCCGHGGSWSGKCGSAWNSKPGHTWQEGIRVCKDRQFQAVVVQQLHGSQPKGNVSVVDASVVMESKAAIVESHMLTSTRANTSTAMTDRSSIVPASTSVITQEFGHSFHVVTHISATAFIVCWY